MGGSSSSGIESVSASRFMNHSLFKSTGTGEGDIWARKEETIEDIEERMGGDDENEELSAGRDPTGVFESLLFK
jgi:hypothetical protein